MLAHPHIRKTVFLRATPELGSAEISRTAAQKALLSGSGLLGATHPASWDSLCCSPELCSSVHTAV